MFTLKDAAIGSTVKVLKLRGEGAVKRRIMDMGITKGVEIYIRKVAPLGDPIELNLRGYELSLRKADAEKIEVELLSGEMAESAEAPSQNATPEAADAAADKAAE